MHTCNSSHSVLDSSESDKIDSGRQGPKIYIDRRENEKKNSSVRRVLLMKVYALTWNDWPRDSHRSDVVHNLSGKTRNSHTSVEI